jgi:hypothetical protein
MPCATRRLTAAAGPTDSTRLSNGERVMARTLTTPRDPDAVGLAVLALRHFVNPVPAPTAFEVDTAATLTKLKIPKATAARMLQHFDSIRPTVRERFLGKPYDAKTRPAKRIVRRDPNAITTGHVLIPQFTFSDLFRRPPGPPPGDQVLAPIDYTITYEGLYCIDETGPDWWGSDESYVVTSAVHITPGGANVVRTERHPFAGNQQDAYSDVDSEEVRIGPRAACWNGAVANVTAGMSLTTTVFDHDEGDPDAYRDEVDAAVKLAIAIATYIYPPAGAILALIEASGLITDFFNWLLGTGDDEVGTSTLVLELSDLEAYSRSRTTNYTRPGRKATGLNYHFLGTVNDNDYAAAYQVRRNPPAPLFPQTPVE